MNQSAGPGTETWRKGLHLTALVLPVAVWWWGAPFVYGVLIPGSLLALAADLTRVRIAWLHRTIGFVFGPVMRAKERPPLGAVPVVNGATWMVLAGAFVFAAFPFPVAAVAFSMLVLGDAAAALVGRAVGRTRIASTGKTLEGSLAFLGAALLPVAWAWWTGSVGPGVGLAAALVGAVVEATSTRINDNLLIPLAAAAVMTGLGA